MKPMSVLDLVRNVVVQIDEQGQVHPANERARSLLAATESKGSPLEVLFAAPDFDALYAATRLDPSRVVELSDDGTTHHLRWELIAPPAAPRTLIGFTADWEPVQEMLQQVRRESLLFRELVLNILPHHVADALVRKQGVRPKAYRACTVLFTDVVSFSRLAFHLDPVSLIRRLNDYFSAFDNLMEEFGIEKIKTIGDAYMCASGLPDKKNSHAVDCALAALAILDAVRSQRVEPHIVDGLDLANWEMRVGMHSGPCISGVVGSKKFVFDIWGDTVNVASRMESASEASAINVSAATWAELEPFFVGRHRGSQHVKNIGEVEMYFVERLKPEFSADEEGNHPNRAFLAAYCEHFNVNARSRNLEIYPRAVREFVAEGASNRSTPS